MSEGSSGERATEAPTAVDGASAETPVTEVTESEPPAAPATPQFVLEGQPIPISDDEVAAMVRFVAEEAGRDWIRPPVIVGDDEATFSEELQPDAEELADAQEDFDTGVRFLQAVGLTTKTPTEVFDAFLAVITSTEGVLGFYDPETDKLHVPVDAVSLDTFRATLVHELVHALDGQYVDLAAILEAQGDADGVEVSPTTSIIEGRASSIENEWRDQNNIPLEEPEQSDVVDAVPPAILLDISLPYLFGPIFIDSQGGAAETWDLLESPPESSEQIMFPERYPDDQPVTVPFPEADGELIDASEFGAAEILTWLVGESLEPDPLALFSAINAADGFGGGAAVLWGDESTSCYRVAMVADTPSDLTEIEDAFAAWADDGDDRTVENDGDQVVVTGCAPYLS